MYASFHIPCRLHHGDLFPPFDQRKKRTMIAVSAGLSEDKESMLLSASSSPPRGRQVRPANLFLLDVAPLCYIGKKPSPSALIGWLKPQFFSITSTHPIIAVMDGERGTEYRKKILPSYKSNRKAFVPLSKLKHRETWKGDDADLREALPLIKSSLKACGIPVVSLEDAEADDVVASLTEQAIHKGFRVTIASPDKDFKQLLSENVQLLTPLADLHRWTFYTEKLYAQQHGCSPSIELGLREILSQGLEEYILCA